MNARPSLIQFSLSELIAVMTIATIVLGSMWTSREVVSGVVVGVVLLVLAWFTLALVGHGRLRAFAIGFVVFVLGYHLIAAVVVHGVVALNVIDNRMPPIRLWGQLHEPIVRRVFMKDGQPIDASLEPTLSSRGIVTDKQGNRLGTIHFTGAGRPRIEVVDRPGLREFYTVGELLWTLLLGYLGGKFAVVAYRYQQRNEVS